ncbi:hypothetical protein KIN20_013729 [Parelaphostrongylus tenuis]|uniref:Uncharacterized protein n=1 Tax=Parelaphostrongylus tenuis TaxID=148309 RepID=A0AAD5MG12_PARTN|nr:hypothetical protein KIN20_013729 [Parelaphostrongylus tenuis]
MRCQSRVYGQQFDSASRRRHRVLGRRYAATSTPRTTFVNHRTGAISLPTKWCECIELSTIILEERKRRRERDEDDDEEKMTLSNGILFETPSRRNLDEPMRS